jgi:phosphotransferase system HPr-like phosphotransfer protein
MMLAAGQGSKLMLVLDGPDEGPACEALVALINDRFGEPD